MASGMDSGSGAGVFAYPDAQGQGVASWGMMSGVHPSDPLVGGRAGNMGGAGILVTGNERQVAVGAPSPTAGAASGAPMSANWRELGNLRGNPIGWVLIASIIYLGLAHISLKGQARVGKSKAGAGVSI